MDFSAGYFVRSLFFATAFALVCACGDDSSSGADVPASSAVLESSSAVEPESSSSDDGVSSSSIEILSSSALEEVSSSSIGDFVSSSSAAVAGDTVWNKANLTWYTSWPEPGSEECEDYNGCTWAGWFAGLEDQQTEEWVSEHNIIAVHKKDWDTYKLKTFRLRKNGYTIDAVVYDMCADDDCEGCCTKNAGKIGFLIDIESYTKARFNNQGSGVVEWTCLDCE